MNDQWALCRSSADAKTFTSKKMWNWSQSGCCTFILYFILFKKNIKIKFYFILLYFILLLFHAFFYSCFVLIGALFKQYSFNYGKSLHIAILLYMLHYAKCSIWGPAVVQGRAWSVLQGGPFPLCIIIKSLGWMF